MTENCQSILMWSHYANHHSGICLEYDLQNIPSDSEMRQNLYPVVYSDKLFDGSHLFTTEKAEEAELLAASLNKSRAWAYEQEWRIVLPNPSENAGQFLEGLIPSKILIGARMPKGDVDLIMQVANSKKLRTDIMYIDYSKFGLAQIAIA